MKEEKLPSKKPSSKKPPSKKLSSEALLSKKSPFEVTPPKKPPSKKPPSEKLSLEKPPFKVIPSKKPSSEEPSSEIIPSERLSSEEPSSEVASSDPLFSDESKHYYLSIETSAYEFLEKVHDGVDFLKSLNVTIETILLWAYGIYLNKDRDTYIRRLQELHCESFLALDSLKVPPPQCRAHFVFRHNAIVFMTHIKDRYPLLCSTHSETIRLNLLFAKDFYEMGENYFYNRLKEVYGNHHKELSGK